MFMVPIYEAWKNYREDFGLSRITYFICFYNTLLFILSGVLYQQYQTLCLLPPIVALVFHYFKDHAIKQGSLALFIYSIIPIIFTILLNYFLVGIFDQAVGGVPRQDSFFVDWDQGLFGMPVATFFFEKTLFLDSFQKYFYDFLMLSYWSYFFMPLYAGILYYRQLERQNHYKLGRLFSSIIIYFSLNYLFYLAVPVTGPQYFINDSFQQVLPLTGFGHFLHQRITLAQGTHIDCFPSGHVGTMVLISIWVFRMRNPHRYFIYFITLSIAMATLALRYHYTLDIIAAIPMAILCYIVGRALFPISIEKRSRKLA